MNASDLVHVMLSALFAAAAVNGVRRAASGAAGRRGRGGQLLHAATASGMAVMPRSQGNLPRHPAAPVFFAVAAPSFPLTVIRRHQESGVAVLVRRLPATTGMAATTRMACPAHAAGRRTPGRRTPQHRAGPPGTPVVRRPGGHRRTGPAFPGVRPVETGPRHARSVRPEGPFRRSARPTRALRVLLGRIDGAGQAITLLVPH